MSNEIGSGYSGGDYSQADFWNGEEAAHNIAKVDSPNTNKNRVRADHFNDVAAELVAVQKRLGAGIRGAQNSLEERLDRGLNTYGDPGGIRHTIGFDDFETCLKNNTTAAVAGEIHGEPGHTETVTNQEWLEGESKTKIILPPNYKIDHYLTDTVTDKGFLRFDGKTDIIIDGGEWDGNSVNNGYQTEHVHGIMIVDCERVRIRNVYMHDWAGDCIHIYNSQDVVIENCTLINENKNDSAPLIGRQCISIVNGTEATDICRNIRIVNCTLKYGNPAAIDIEPNGAGECQDIIISNCRISSANRGIAIEPATGREARRVVIGNNIIRDCGYGLTLGGAGTHDGVVVCNNEIYDSEEYGIWLNNGEDCQIFGNLIKSGDKQGILLVLNNTDIDIQGNQLVENGSAGIGMAGTEGNENLRVWIRNNMIVNNGQGATNPGIEAARTNYLKITNNVIYDSQDTPTQNYPARIQYCEEVFYNGNMCFGHATADAYYSANNTNFNAGANVQGSSLVQSDPNLDDPTLNVTGPSKRVTIETADDTGVYNDIILINNNYVGGTKIGIIGNKDIFMLYENGVGLAKIDLDTVQFADGRIHAAATPANFAANYYLHIKNHSGTDLYIPVMAATW